MCEAVYISVDFTSSLPPRKWLDNRSGLKTRHFKLFIRHTSPLDANGTSNTTVESIHYWDTNCTTHRSSGSAATSAYVTGSSVIVDCFQPAFFDYKHPDVGRILLTVEDYTAGGAGNGPDNITLPFHEDECVFESELPVMISPFDPKWSLAGDKDAEFAIMVVDMMNETRAAEALGLKILTMHGNSSSTDIATGRHLLDTTLSYSVGICSASASINSVSATLLSHTIQPLTLPFYSRPLDHSVRYWMGTN